MSGTNPRPDSIRAIADAVLYEGYILWPYRRSAMKNQRRFTFGGVHPPEHARRHPDDPSMRRTEVLVQGGAGVEVEVSVRFLQIVERTAARLDGDRLVPVDELEVDGQLHLSWEEAVEREVRAPAATLSALGAGVSVAIHVPAASSREHVRDGSGRVRGALLRRWRGLAGRLSLAATPVAGAPGVWRLTATVANDTPFAGGDREAAMPLTFCSVHTTLHAPRGGAFVSATDPPAELARAAAACRNQGTWPVLAGAAGDRTTILSSPIILEDHPRIAPESPGDLFDGGEIDQLLVLNILALTDAEKAEMAASDPRAREILERTEALTPEQLMALHATVRDVGLARR